MKGNRSVITNLQIGLMVVTSDMTSFTFFASQIHSN